MFLQRVAYIKNISIIFYTCAITLRLRCNFSKKPLSRIVQKRRKRGKNVEMNHWLKSGVGIWKLVESLLRRETNWLSCLYVIKKRESIVVGQHLQSTNRLDGHRGIQIKQLAPKQDIDYKISQGTKRRQGNDTY